MNSLHTISGKPLTAPRRLGQWAPVARSFCTPGFLKKLDKRRAKNKVAKQSRKVNR